MKVAGFLKTSLLDWEGKVVSTIYLSGCNLRCPFCHNPELITPHKDSECIPWEEVERYLRINDDFLDGIVISGGEPTINPDIYRLLRRLKELNFEIKLDTNGTTPEILDDLIGAGLVDFVAMDIKGPLDHRYDDLCGKEAMAESVKKSVKVVIDSGIDHEFRTTVLPVYLKEKDIEDIARSLVGAKRYVLQQFRPKVTLDPKLSAIDPLPESRLRTMADIARKYVKEVKVRGI
ncbi:MAG TPA: anaerobic ribonucleoside-triphosphate reductase activating protein [Candidatus Methanomethylophilaceae archaeon]|nr:anaerobic ribonucleoside-triphosphate reductase activating protein [Candidatus Methanomethylophilaceae archaeon]